MLFNCTVSTRKNLIKNHCRSDIGKDFLLFIVSELIKGGDLWGGNLLYL